MVESAQQDSGKLFHNGLLIAIEIPANGGRAHGFCETLG